MRPHKHHKESPAEGIALDLDRSENEGYFVMYASEKTRTGKKRRGRR